MTFRNVLFLLPEFGQCRTHTTIHGNAYSQGFQAYSHQALKEYETEMLFLGHKHKRVYKPGGSA